MKFLVTLSDEQQKALDEMMSEDVATNRTAFLVMLIGEEKKKRDEAKKKAPRGRPRKEDVEIDEYEDEPDYSHDLPKTIPHFGRMIGARELADIERTQQDFRPH